MNKKYISILIFLVVISVVYAAEQQVYVLKLNYDKGLVTLDSITLTTGIFNPILNQPDAEYRLEFITFDGGFAYVQNFNFELEIASSPPLESFDEEGNPISFPSVDRPKALDKTTIELIIPYNPNGKVINIYDPNNEKILEVDVEHLARFCGNDVCDPNENYESCSSDCELEEVSIEEPVESTNFVLIILAFVAILIILSRILKKSKQMNRK
jgi:hypothetical protein